MSAMDRSRSITIVIPALNEEEQLEWSVRNAVAGAQRWFADFEVLLFDDGSTDRTAAIADRLAGEIPQLIVTHHQKPHGIGGVLKAGLQRARMEYFFWCDSKGATPPEALDAIFSRCGEADLIVPYGVNQEERPPSRRLISRAFCGVLNLTFGLDLRQYTHLVLCETAVARRVHVRTDSHAYQAEALIKMIKSGCSYVQVGVRDDFSRQQEHSKAFRLPNVVGVAWFFAQVFWDVHLGRGR